MNKGQGIVNVARKRYEDREKSAEPDEDNSVEVQCSAAPQT
ncbi:hypothetical protein [Pandoraea terrigena]|nr:hypothetical protein [Pandoraea terrigena]